MQRRLTELAVATVTAGMTMSLDGFVADASGSADALFTDLEDLRDTAYMKDAIARTSLTFRVVRG